MAKAKLLRAIALLLLTISPQLATAQEVDRSEIQSEAKKIRDKDHSLSQDMERLVQDALRRSQRMHGKVKELTDSAQSPQKGVGEALSGFELPEATPNEKATLYIFVSSSMPNSLIQEYMKDAVRYRAVVVIRGFINNSMKETVSTIQRIVEENDGEGGVMIDPKTFEVFDVEHVPTIVLAKEPAELCFSSDCIIETPEHDKITGSVSVKYALEQFRTYGELPGFASYRLSEGQ